MAQVSVLDQGPGIGEDERSLIFRRFWRRDRRKAGSTGLGLSIVRRIAELHSTVITVENRKLRRALVAEIRAGEVVSELGRIVRRRDLDAIGVQRPFAKPLAFAEPLLGEFGSLDLVRSIDL